MPTIDFPYYFKKSGDTEVLPYEKSFIYGTTFVTYNVVSDAIEIVQASGEGCLIENYLTAEARKYHKSKIRFVTRRNPKVFERKYGCKTVGYVLEKDVCA
jgi:hypothetical protein